MSPVRSILSSIRISKLSLVSVVLAGCLFMTACAPWAVTLMNQIVTGTVGAINLAAALKGTTPDAALITKIQTEGAAFIKAYTDWEAAAPTLKPGAWAKVQEAMTLIQQDLPPILNGFGVTNPAYVAVADFVISEVLSLANTITGTSQMAATKKTVTKPKAMLSPADFKKGYNEKMKAAGHPEFGIK